MVEFVAFLSNRHLGQNNFAEHYEGVCSGISLLFSCTR